MIMSKNCLHSAIMTLRGRSGIARVVQQRIGIPTLDSGLGTHPLSTSSAAEEWNWFGSEYVLGGSVNRK